MKFENIKVGDVVFTQSRVRYGSVFGRNYKYFYLPEIVERVTKKQFVTKDNYRFDKERGAGIGHDGFAYLLGDDYGRGIIKDQTKDCELFELKIGLETEIENVLTSIKIIPNSKLSIKEL